MKWYFKTSVFIIALLCVGPLCITVTLVQSSLQPEEKDNGKYYRDNPELLFRNCAV
jgi:hypothetical protein